MRKGLPIHGGHIRCRNHGNLKVVDLVGETENLDIAQRIRSIRRPCSMIGDLQRVLVDTGDVVLRSRPAVIDRRYSGPSDDGVVAPSPHDGVEAVAAVDGVVAGVVLSPGVVLLPGVAACLTKMMLFPVVSVTLLVPLPRAMMSPSPEPVMVRLSSPASV